MPQTINGLCQYTDQDLLKVSHANLKGLGVAPLIRARRGIGVSSVLYLNLKVTIP
jgi:hypothetical protein